mgnify:CR=1 FL=1
MVDSLAYAEMRWWLPYCVHEVDDEQAVRLVLNRHKCADLLTARHRSRRLCMA